MSEATPRPQNSDAIIGGQNLPSVTGAVLGELEGAKRCFESETLSSLKLVIEIGLTSNLNPGVKIS